ncbi:MAG: GNAT family N-acetyltransferase [Gemmatimonadetes bacterium]|nr:GNAT family N-acetyltransferase [Gemmatimonadota bacterium]
MDLNGTKVVLRKATEADRRNIFEWLTHSDVTPSMMGPPLFPDARIPTWAEFCEDYRPHYFDDSQPHQGRCFILVVDGTDVGVVCHNAFHDDTTDLDIWLRSEADCGKGIGSEAIRTITNYLNREFGIKRIAISPSARNPRAIAAYRKAGFELVKDETASQFIKPEGTDYSDNLVLVKRYQ